MYRRAYALLIGVAATMGLLAIIASLSVDRKLADPEGFLGPAWVRLPMLLVGAFLMDICRARSPRSGSAPAGSATSSGSGWPSTGPASG